MGLFLMLLQPVEAGAPERAVQSLVRQVDKQRWERAASELEALDDLPEALALRAWLNANPEHPERGFFLIGLAGLYVEVGEQRAATALVDEMLDCCLESVPEAWGQLARSRHVAARHSGLSVDYDLALQNYLAYLEERPEDEQMQAALADCKRESLAAVDLRFEGGR